jgi:hypothetical protein
MSETITITIENDEGEETEHELPSKMEVCYDCEGHGMVLNESMRYHAYTCDDEEMHDPEFREEYFRRGGIYDVQCPTCKGRNVIKVIDREMVEKNEALKPILAQWDEQEEDRAQADAEYEAECRMERMFCGDY